MFWDVMECQWLTDSHCFEGSEYSHLQSQGMIKYVHMRT